MAAGTGSKPLWLRLWSAGWALSIKMPDGTRIGSSGNIDAIGGQRTGQPWITAEEL